jgi:hypothetical protein
MELSVAKDLENRNHEVGPWWKAERLTHKFPDVAITTAD